MQLKLKIIILAFVLLTSNAFSAESNKNSSRVGVDLGVGFDLGVGLSAQYRNYTFFLNGDALAVDYRIQNFHNDNNRLNLYIDLGAFIESHGKNKDDSVGIRLPIGMTFGIERNLEVYLQAVPNYDFSDDEGFGVDGAAGIRYRF